ncbi:small multi-drug export protein [Bacillus sinesaloumensis]|uniref:small multi-drug export protein n=1 Tax=Litchfieldia sinesaloumensis TaxID=1926280 RepID=UPI0009883625|nr:small multi-drug export protein [Bacillus sinesaloumensis]
MLISYLLVFILAAVPLFELIAVIPIAIVGGLSPIPVAILGFLGNLLTVLLLILFVDKIKVWMKARKQKKNPVREVERMEPLEGEGIISQESAEIHAAEESKKEKRARTIFDKYGLPGLTILGPLLVGSHISAFMSMSFGSSRKLVTGWMITSLLVWTIVFTALAGSGISFFAPEIQENGFLVRMFK